MPQTIPESDDDSFKSGLSNHDGSDFKNDLLRQSVTCLTCHLQPHAGEEKVLDTEFTGKGAVAASQMLTGLDG